MTRSLRWNIAQYLEIRWWKRYLKNRDVDEYLEWKRNYWNEFIKPLSKSLKLPSATNVLDAGCGPAGIFITLDQLKVSAVDPLLDHYDKEINHFKRADYPEVDFSDCPIEEFRTERRFDIVFCLNAINHVAKIDKAMDVLVDHLVPGGRLLLSIDCHKSNTLKALFKMLPGDALHPHQLSLGDYREMILDRNLKILDQVKVKSGSVFDYYAIVAEKKNGSN